MSNNLFCVCYPQLSSNKRTVGRSPTARFSNRLHAWSQVPSPELQNGFTASAVDRKLILVSTDHLHNS
jgi:hypothetical protein